MNKTKTINDWIEYQSKIIEQEKSSNFFIDIIDLKKLEISENKVLPLNNISFSIKNNFSIDSSLTTAATQLLSNFKPNFNATIYTKLIDSGAIPLFSVNLDELAMGGSGLNSNFGMVLNPYDSKRICGGSSSGSAYSVAKDIVEFSIASDTGDSVRKPASYTGLVGFKPTWGIVSRYGLFDFAPSFDTVSWFTKNVSLSALLLDVLQGFDEKDFSSIQSKQHDYLNSLQLETNFKVGYFKKYVDQIDDLVVKENWEKTVELLKKNNIELIDIDFDENLMRSVLPMYQTITSVEAFSCNSNLSGFLFGKTSQKENFENILTKAREEGFAYEVKKRFLWANYAIGEKNLYTDALKIRTLIIEKMKTIFEQVDILLMPAAPTVPPLIENYEHQKTSSNLLEDFLALHNANGSPSITIPNHDKKENHLPTGINISSAPFKDKECLQFAFFLEKLLL